MDIATIVGVILGFGAVIGGQVLEGGHVSSLIQPTAAIIVLGGTMGATFVSFPLGELKRAASNVSKALFPMAIDTEETIRLLVEFANKARKNGLITLEQDLKRVNDLFLRRGVELVVDGVEAEEVRLVLEIELSAHEESIKGSAEVFEAAGGFAPTIGIIGAVLGLIHVMNNLSDTASLGAGIAVAFVATIYGLMTANIVCIPLSTKLKRRLKEQLLQREIVIEGLMSLMKGENPRMIEQKLRGFNGTSQIGASATDEQKKKGA